MIAAARLSTAARVAGPRARPGWLRRGRGGEGVVEIGLIGERDPKQHVVRVRIDVLDDWPLRPCVQRPFSSMRSKPS
jgi:hypothetical protein